MPSDIERILKREAQRYAADVRRYVKARERADKTRSDWEEMSAEGSRRYPAGVRPFKSASELRELDEPLPAAMGQEYAFTVTLPQNVTRREAMAAVHHASAVFFKQMEMETAAAHADTLAPLVTRGVFIQGCRDKVVKARELDPLGLEDPITGAVNEHAVMNRIEQYYGDVVTALRKEKTAEKAKAEKEKEEQRKQQQQLTKERPEVLLQELVESLVDKRLRGEAPMEDEAPPATNTDTKAQDFCDALASNKKSKKKAKTKNGGGPGKGPGNEVNSGDAQNQKGKGHGKKGKAKGNGKEQGKKGKGCTRWAKGKGKGGTKSGKGKSKGGWSSKGKGPWNQGTGKGKAHTKGNVSGNGGGGRGRKGHGKGYFNGGGRFGFPGGGKGWAWQ